MYKLAQNRHGLLKDAYILTTYAIWSVVNSQNSVIHIDIKGVPASEKKSLLKKIKTFLYIDSTYYFLGLLETAVREFLAITEELTDEEADALNYISQILYNDLDIILLSDGSIVPPEKSEDEEYEFPSVYKENVMFMIKETGQEEQWYVNFNQEIINIVSNQQEFLLAKSFSEFFQNIAEINSNILLYYTLVKLKNEPEVFFSDKEYKKIPKLQDKLMIEAHEKLNKIKIENIAKIVYEDKPSRTILLLIETLSYQISLMMAQVDILSHFDIATDSEKELFRMWDNSVEIDLNYVLEIIKNFEN